MKEYNSFDVEVTRESVALPNKPDEYNSFDVQVLMLKGEKGDIGDAIVQDGSVTRIKLATEVRDQFDAIGDLTELQTTDKSSLVDAVNEVAGAIITPADYIVEQGTSGIWTYRKWNSGIAECWGSATVTINTTGTLWKTPIYAFLNVARQSYPFTFNAVPNEIVGVKSGTNAMWLYKQAGSDNSTTQTAQYALIKVDAFDNNTTAVLSYHVTGSWK